MVQGWQVSPHRRNPVTVGQGGLQCAIDSLGADRCLRPYTVLGLPGPGPEGGGCQERLADAIVAGVETKAGL
jgi:hypothetical protein